MLAEYFSPARVALARLLWIALAAGALPGCGTMYVAQAAIGQWHVMHARRPIDDVVLDKRTAAPVREELFRVREAREFASRVLKLPDNRSYRMYADIHRQFVVWNVVATPEFSVEPQRWCFPVAGCVAYRGYFKERKARAFAAALAKQGDDVAVGGVPAYSTLGKFADPVLSTMLGYGEDELAATIFHELAHQLLYVKNDTEFNEAFAMTVEEDGLRRWLTQRGQPGAIIAYRRQREHEREFVDLFTRARDKLAKLYASRQPPADMRAQKKAILAQLGTDLGALEQRLHVRSPLYDQWIKEGLNNAHLTSLATYYDCMPGFERLLAQEDGDLPRFYAAARELARLSRAQRHDMLCKKTPPPAQTSRAERAAAADHSTQRDQDDRVAAPHFEHQYRGAFGTVAQLLQARHFAAIGAHDHIVVAQAGLSRRAAGVDVLDQRAALIGGVSERRPLECAVDTFRWAGRIRRGFRDDGGHSDGLAFA